MSSGTRDAPSAYSPIPPFRTRILCRGIRNSRRSLFVPDEGSLLIRGHYEKDMEWNYKPKNLVRMGALLRMPQHPSTPRHSSHPRRQKGEKEVKGANPPPLPSLPPPTGPSWRKSSPSCRKERGWPSQRNRAIRRQEVGQLSTERKSMTAAHQTSIPTSTARHSGLVTRAFRPEMKTAPPIMLSSSTMWERRLTTTCSATRSPPGS